MKKFFVLIISLALLLGALLVDMFFIEPNMLLVKNQKVYVPNWIQELNGFKIAVVSDLHIGTKNVNPDKLKTVVRKVNANNPDLVVLLGDLDALAITNSKIDENEIAEILNGFNAQSGIVSILGNHDYKPPYIVKRILKKAQIPLLENESLYLDVNKHKIRIVGFKDLWHHYLNPKKIVGKSTPGMPLIVLMHNPDSFPEVPSSATISLSGHNHGGEMILPFVGSPCVPSKYGQRYRKGYIVENNKHLYVSGGVATLSKLRLFNPPEITILHLYSQTAETQNTKPLKGIKKNYAPQIMKRLKKNQLT